MKYTALFVSLVLFSALLPASVPNPPATYVSGSAAIPNGAVTTTEIEHSCIEPHSPELGYPDHARSSFGAINSTQPL